MRFIVLPADVFIQRDGQIRPFPPLAVEQLRRAHGSADAGNRIKIFILQRGAHGAAEQADAHAVGMIERMRAIEDEIADMDARIADDLALPVCGAKK